MGQNAKKSPITKVAKLRLFSTRYVLFDHCSAKQEECIWEIIDDKILLNDAEKMIK